MFSAIKTTVQVFLGLGLTSILASPAWGNLSLEEINAIARQTTVVIAPGLTPDLVSELEANRNNPLASKKNADGVWNPGSGVIVARRKNTYYALTVTHNFKQRYLEQNIPYGIRTSDGEVHPISEVNDRRNCPLQERIEIQKLIRFGCYSITIPNRLAGTDLAIVSFESKNEYPIASVGDADRVAIGDQVYISGWPDPEKEKDPTTGVCKGKVARRKRRLAWTPVTRKIATAQSENGYNLFYFDLTRPGMSGGPVFDSEGYVVGIHGRGSADKGKLVRQYCSLELAETNRQALESGDLESNEVQDLVQAAVNYTAPVLHSQFSSGQNTGNFWSLWQELGINLKLLFNEQAPTRDFINSGLTALSQDNTTSGVLDVDVREDITGAIELEAPQDVIEDIYSGFSLKNMIRDEPSPGCGFLLLGDPCKKL
ncbi:trypsin-like serine protease with C-terminal PDZ domain [Xenococcus sp. PCC 7305]|uniref:S1 family peptidase n=1 Tax=Xenococcus sp. PCC 7305 TaxID=102125 RepID=UPI0002AC3E06|nr:serine protease [Xenococcus sp. PCC 7305]ELS04902.1 trypsin-like serine protease with C-terminal PDZ domain [Xenococcus sp. PCC 7305]